VQEQLQAVGIAAGNALRVDELFTDPQVTHRGSFAWVDHPEIGGFPHTRTAWQSQLGNSGVAGPAPLFGEANDYVLSELLGMSAPQIERLLQANVVVRQPLGWQSSG
jgi:crotonobetainyl-CoA:carnitine CoA-transferase CaiB-like acyl-CoA transferase